MPRKKPIVLCILDGWGLTKDTEYSAIAKAKTPNFDEIFSKYPRSILKASGQAVGLPEGQMGNSEVGHMNIGAGRIVFQTLPKIDKNVKDNTLKDIQLIKKTIVSLKKSKGDLHLLGLLSDGGVHSHITHIIALAKIFADEKINVKVHCFLDGRDTPQKSALTYIEQFQSAIEEYDNISIATLGGRYYGMDRDNRWDRIEKAYNIIVSGEELGQVADPATAIKESYTKDKTDEFLEPIAITGYQGMKTGDAFIFANFRADRAREISMALANPNFSFFDRKKTVDFVEKIQMTEYSAEHNEYLDTIFPPNDIRNSLGEIIAKQGLKQLRIAETEKYAHVTFFFSGGKEEKFKDEERILVDSPKIATYDLKPEMSASVLTEKLIKEIQSDKFDFILVNYANPDMVGHTGVMEAAIKACEEVDKELGKLIKAIKEKDGLLFVAADHGNAEKMFDKEKQEPFTAHTSNPVPFILVAKGAEKLKLANGILANIAPTILHVMGIEKPKEMTEESLLRK
jgi:2,3-bisphosphoglycerate-independent phosphoglycerate mutase